MRRSITSAALALVVAVAEPVPAQPPGFWVVVPQGGRDVWVPVDGSGRPLLAPGVPGIPGLPVAPAVPPVPPMPWVLPPVGDLLVLRFDAVPEDVRIVIDGVTLDPALRRYGFALAPGRHVLEFVRPGLPGVPLTLEAPRPAVPGSGYQVVPRP